MGMEIETKSSLIEVEPVLTNFATPYTAGDQLGVPMVLADILDDTKGTGVVLSVCVVDKNKTKKGIDIRIFREQPTTVADNAALSYSDTEAKKLLGRISISAGDYGDTALSSDATIKNIGFTVKSIAGSRDLWVVFQCTQDATYAAIDDLNFKFGAIQD